MKMHGGARTSFLVDRFIKNARVEGGQAKFYLRNNKMLAVEFVL